jgi:peptide/nickel transport system substrate-binding protein
MTVPFKYGIVGDPIPEQPVEEEPVPNPPVWTVSTNTDRVKWLCQANAYEYEKKNKDDVGKFIQLRKVASFGGKIERVRFYIFESQKEAVEALIKGKVDFVPALTEPEEVRRALGNGLSAWEAPSHYNLHYLGFRTDREPFTDPEYRRRVIKTFAINDSLRAAGVLTWKAAGVLPGFPGDELYHIENPEVDPPNLTGKTLLYNEFATIDTTIATTLKGRDRSNLTFRGVKGYGELVKELQHDQDNTNPKYHMFLYNWYVRANDVRRVLFPLFHSRNIPHPNLTRYDKADELIDQLPEPFFARTSEKDALARIYEHTPIFVLYHAHRTAVWREEVQGLQSNLTDPECNPADRLLSVTVK